MMKHFSVFSLLCVTPIVAGLLAPRPHYEERFVDWMHKHGHNFGNGEFAKRLKIWAEADDYIEMHNQGNHTYTLGHNQYSHLTPEEFKGMMGLGKDAKTRRHGDQGLDAVNIDELAESIDWVELGAVTDVKNQGQCGSCWSFSSTGALEGAFFVKYNKLVSFSEEMLVSCDDNGDHGCNGGLMDNAFEWIKENGGLCTEEDYPYTGEVDRCAKNKCKVVKGSGITGWTDVKQTEVALMSALNKNPVSVAIEADQRSFQLYSSGVFTGRCGDSLDHGVLAVGYGTQDGIPYWKVKNSWDSSWGENGYIKIEKGTKERGGKCGILLSASYPRL